MKLFRPDGSMFEFDEDLFVEYYKDDYFLNKAEYHVPDLRNRSNGFVEDEIIKILKKGKTKTNPMIKEILPEYLHGK